MSMGMLELMRDCITSLLKLFGLVGNMSQSCSRAHEVVLEHLTWKLREEEIHHPQPLPRGINAAYAN